MPWLLGVSFKASAMPIATEICRITTASQLKLCRTHGRTMFQQARKSHPNRNRDKALRAQTDLFKKREPAFFKSSVLRECETSVQAIRPARAPQDSPIQKMRHRGIVSSTRPGCNTGLGVHKLTTATVNAARGPNRRPSSMPQSHLARHN